jgi:hypothetical protein
LEDGSVSKLTKSQELELKHLWESGQSVVWLDKLREYAPEEEKKIPSYVLEAIEKVRNAPKRSKGLAVLDDCTPEKLEYYANAPDDEIIIDLRHWKGFDPKTETKTITAGMLRALLAAVRNEPKATEILDRNLRVTLKEVEQGLRQDPDEASWLATSGMFDEVMIRLFGREPALSIAGTKLRNIALFILRREIEDMWEISK